MEHARDDWEALAEEALETSTFAVELAALSEDELPGSGASSPAGPTLPFAYLSVHAPVEARAMSEEDLVARLEHLAPAVDAIVVHPDVIEEPGRYWGSGPCSSSRTWTRASPRAAPSRSSRRCSPRCRRPASASTSRTR